jgi:type IV pilus assembly protein PilE
MQHTSRRSFGFTLIELMIVVAVIAILAAIAFPSYQNYVRNAQRSDGMTALMGIALAQERHRANNVAYAGSIATLAGVGAKPGGTDTTSRSPPRTRPVSVPRQPSAPMGVSPMAAARLSHLSTQPA